MGIHEAYREEVRERSRLAACARYRRGRKQRGCRLPSDRLTNAQLERRSGPVRVYHLGELSPEEREAVLSGGRAGREEREAE